MCVFIIVLECMIKKKIECKKATYYTTSLADYVDQCKPAAWAGFFDLTKVQQIVKQISVVMTKEAKKTYFEPRMPLMFKALDMVAPKQVKVVILGQDPTPQAGKATGLAFSVDNPKTVGTVLNVLLEAALEGWHVDINNGNLESWANQGVLLLNTAFTCQQNQRGSHLNLWRKFSQYLIKYISDKAQPSVWFLWGNEAQKYNKPAFIDAKKHYIITGGHPSPLGGIGTNKFFGGNYFNCANNLLAKIKRRPLIYWGLARRNKLKPCPPQPNPPKGKNRRKSKSRPKLKKVKRF